jgi:hypothetical protein
MLMKQCVGSAAVVVSLLARSEVTAQEIALGSWGKKAEMIEPNSEFASVEADGKIYVLGGYPAGRFTVRTIQIYDIETDH